MDSEKKRRIRPMEFARMFVQTRCGSEAAVRLGAGQEEAKTEAARLLSRASVRKRISRLDSEDSQTLSYVKTGLSRLAFGAVNDAVMLVFKEEPTAQDIMSADLFNVSEIKRLKGGGVEIKFFDRQKALEKLVELDPELRDLSPAEELLRAVCGGDGDYGSHAPEESDGL